MRISLPSCVSCGRFADARVQVDEPQDLEEKVLTPALKPFEFYTEQESVFAALKPQNGKLQPVKLLDSVWVLERAERLEAASTDEERALLALPCRQDLEEQSPEAFITFEELCALPKNDSSVEGVKFDASDDGNLAMGSVSHAWMTARHPDPLGQQLVNLAKTIRDAQQGRLACQQPNSDWFPFKSMHFRKLPRRFGLFYDWCSIFQAKKDENGNVLRDRSTAERDAFNLALETMQLWYVHTRLFVFLLTELPTDCPALPYGCRGWPTVERAWANMTKTASANCWPMIYQVGSQDVVPRSRDMLLHPVNLGQLLYERRFTSPKADRPLVMRLYRETALSVLAGSRVLNFGSCGWTDEAFVMFARVMPLCVNCVTLLLNNNACSDAGASAVACAAAGSLPMLQDMTLSGNDIGDAGFFALAAALSQKAMPGLKKLSLKRNRASQEAKDVLRSAIALMPRCECILD